MDVNSRFIISPTRLLIFFLVLFHIEKSTVMADEVLCSGDMSLFLPLPYGKLPNMVCKRVWNSFVLRYSQTDGNVITIVLSTVYTTGWVGIGFSKDGMMLNSSCMVGWVNKEGRARIKEYYAEGFTPLAVKPDKGELPLTSVPPYVALNGATIYLAFQLKYPTHLKRQPILLAYSRTYPTPQHHHLSLHDDKTTINLDFSSGGNSGSAAPSGGTSYRVDDMKKAHGVLSLLGWGLFLPCGAIVARYFRHRDPLWYYVHVPIEFLGFILGVSGAVVGLSLDHKVQADIVGHKTIGIFVLVLGILQVMAFFARPSNDSKNRKYWNWYHSWSGRISIFLAAINIVLGIHIGNAGQEWRVGYGILVGVILIACIVLETLSRLKRFHNPEYPSDFPMNGM
ncbi:hypothetical protein ACH5RR_000073 [Cinchona calisaya]|uniref:Cytochrome b561 and DOMON domain-containing protein n=1 Tax=Cinchona calisaya TaxID=153742 RepID=A0ABD3AZK5_9GENT